MATPDTNPKHADDWDDATFDAAERDAMARERFGSGPAPAPAAAAAPEAPPAHAPPPPASPEAPRPVQIVHVAKALTQMEDMALNPGTVAALAQVQQRIGGKRAVVSLLVRSFPEAGRRGWIDFDGTPYPDGNLARKFLGNLMIAAVQGQPTRHVLPLEECKGCNGVGTKAYGDAPPKRCGKCQGKGKVAGTFWSVDVEFFQITAEGGRLSLGSDTGTHKEADFTTEPSAAMKAAIANAYSRGMRRILDLGGVTWEELAAMGVQRPRGESKFQHGSQGGTTGVRHGMEDIADVNAPQWKAFWGKASTLGWKREATKAKQEEMIAAKTTIGGLKKYLDEMQSKIDARAAG